MDYNYNAYEILGLSENATREEVDARHAELIEKYQKDRFLPGDAGEEAAEKMQQVEVAYKDIIAGMSEQQKAAEEAATEADYKDIQQLISDDKLDEAQQKLDDRPTRDAEWHYVQSILFYKRSWFLESKKQLELACQMDPDNQRYKQSLEKLTKILASHTINPEKMRTSSHQERQQQYNDSSAGNGTCTGSLCADCLLCNACCNCMQCMGGCR